MKKDNVFGETSTISVTEIPDDSFSFKGYSFKVWAMDNLEKIKKVIVSIGKGLWKVLKATASKNNVKLIFSGLMGIATYFSLNLNPVLSGSVGLLLAGITKWGVDGIEYFFQK